jgi:hypothetical protein
MAIAAAICGIAIIIFLWICDPAIAPAPQCIFRHLTGYECAGCGSQRAIHALLHGQIAVAWHFNPAIFFAIPIIIIYIINPRRWRRALHSPIALWGIAIAAIAWWILRNI